MAKRAAEAPPRILLGRPSNNLKMGIVGLPNVGKSTLFNTLTQMSVPAENYPFCTIEPNLSRVAVPDERFDWLLGQFNPLSRVPAYLQITDIAGLIRGASTGAGLGNAFLSHIRAVDGIYHVVRIFDDKDVIHVEGAVDPLRDLEIIADELRLKDEEFLNNALAALEKEAKRDKAKRADLEIVQKVADFVIGQKQAVRFGDWTPKEVEVLNELMLLTSKPVVYLVNMSEEDYFAKKSRWLARIKSWVDEHSRVQPEVIIPFCGVLEAKLLTMTPDEQREYLQMRATTSIPKIIKTGFSAINLINFFTVGQDEVKAWTIRKFTKAPQAAGTIHSDMMHGFICAEVMKYVDFKELGSEAECKAKGKHRQQGREYTVEDGDIVFFRFNPSGGKKK